MRPPRIPKSVEMLCYTITIERGPLKEHEDGTWDPHKGRIIVSDRLKGWEAYQTYQHELFHAQLEMLGYEHLSADESFVDRIAALNAQAIKTARSHVRQHSARRRSTNVTRSKRLVRASARRLHLHGRAVHSDSQARGKAPRRRGARA